MRKDWPATKKTACVAVETRGILEKKKILFVCVENSCRSQIAEGLARKLGGNLVEAWSAGSKPSGKVNATAISLMSEHGIDLSVQQSKGLSDLPPVKWDYVFTMGCGDACPFVPAIFKADWAIPDPKNMARQDFEAVIDQIKGKVEQLLQEIVLGVRS